MWTTTISVAPFIIAFLLIVYLGFVSRQERKQLRGTAYQEGLGEEFDLELRRLLEIQNLRPQDAPSGPDPFREALHIVRLRKRTMIKNLPYGGALPTVTLNISGSTIASLNLGTVVGDLAASVQTLQTHGHQQIADAIKALTTAIGKSQEIRDEDRKDLLENLAVVSKEASSPGGQRRSGLLKSSLGFITTLLTTAKELFPLLQDLHEKLKAAGVIDW